jgi:hypothetical protein
MFIMGIGFMSKPLQYIEQSRGRKEVKGKKARMIFSLVLANGH